MSHGVGKCDGDGPGMEDLDTWFEDGRIESRMTLVVDRVLVHSANGFLLAAHVHTAAQY